MKTALWTILLLAGLTGCTTFLDFDDLKVKKQQVPYDLIIDGGLTSDTTTQVVMLSKPVQLGSRFENIPVSQAEITVSTKEATWIFSEDPNTPGFYRSKKEFAAIPGTHNHLEVKSQEKSYEATNFMRPVTPINKETLPIWKGEVFSDPSQPGVIFSNHGFGFAENNRWKLTILTQDEDQSFEITYSFYTHKGIDLAGALGTNIFDQQIPIDTLTDKIILTKYSLSPHYYRFLKAIFRSTDWAGGLFDKVPANGISNVSASGYGYFFATQVNRDTIAYNDLKFWDQIGKTPPSSLFQETHILKE